MPSALKTLLDKCHSEAQLKSRVWWWWRVNLGSLPFEGCREAFDYEFNARIVGDWDYGMPWNELPPEYQGEIILLKAASGWKRTGRLLSTLSRAPAVFEKQKIFPDEAQRPKGSLELPEHWACFGDVLVNLKKPDYKLKDQFMRMVHEEQSRRGITKSDKLKGRRKKGESKSKPTDWKKIELLDLDYIRPLAPDTLGDSERSAISKLKRKHRPMPRE